MLKHRLGERCLMLCLLISALIIFQVQSASASTQGGVIGQPPPSKAGPILSDAPADDLAYSVVATIPVGTSPNWVGVNPTTNTIFVTNYNSASVSVIDGATRAVTQTILVGDNPRGIGVNPTTNMAFTANWQAYTVSVIDGATKTAVGTISVGPGVQGVGINPVTNTIYISDWWNQTVSVIDGSTRTVTQSIFLGQPLDGVGVNPVTNTIFVTDQGTNVVHVIDGATNTITQAIAVGDYPTKIAVNSVTNTIYVANARANTVSVIDGATNTVIHTIPVGNGPAGVGVNPTTNTLFVANYNDGSVSVINGATNTVTHTIPVGLNPNGVGVNPTTNTIYVANGGSNTVSVILGSPQVVVGTDPLLNGCYVYAPSAVNEGDAFQTAVKCHAITSDVFGFQFGTTFTPSMVTRNGVPNQPVAEQVGTSYTEGNFAPTNDLVGTNSLSALYAVSHTGTDTTTGDFTLGTFDANVPLGITANSSVTVDLRDLKLADRSGADIAATLPQSQAVITINNLFIAQREAGTLRVASDGTMTNIRTIHLNLDDGSPLDVASALGSYHYFSVTTYQYAVGKQSADIAISMLSHLSCTKNIPLSDGLNPASVLGTAYTLKAGDANADGDINLYDAVLVGGYFGTSRTDGADINGDGTINIYDLVHIGRNYTTVAGPCS